MPEILRYNREAVVSYAHEWAYRRNPDYYDFSMLGGDCTNFASQCIYAGAGIMNYTPTFGWYYRSANDRTPSWTGVQFLYDFLTRNMGPGPFATEVDLSRLEPGDIVQLAFLGSDRYQHTPVITEIRGLPSLDNIYIAAHSNDVDCRPLSTYQIQRIRCLHIEGVRSET